MHETERREEGGSPLSSILGQKRSRGEKYMKRPQRKSEEEGSAVITALKISQALLVARNEKNFQQDWDRMLRLRGD